MEAIEKVINKSLIGLPRKQNKEGWYRKLSKVRKNGSIEREKNTETQLTSSSGVMKTVYRCSGIIGRMTDSEYAILVK